MYKHTNKHMDEACGKRKSKKAEVGSLKSKTVKDMREELRLKGVQGVDRMNRTLLCKKLQEHVLNIPFLQNDGHNSCYLDSTLVGLFHSDHPWISKTFLSRTRIRHHKNHTRLYDIAKSIQDELTNMFVRQTRHSCKGLRLLMEQFDAEYSKIHGNVFERVDWRRSQQEPRDVFNVFERIVKIPNDVDIRVNRDKRAVTYAAPFVPSSDLKVAGRQPVDFFKYFPVYKDVSTTRYDAANVIAFNVERNYLNTKVKTPFIFPAHVAKLQISLKTIIIHHGQSITSGHYTAMICKGVSWYHFDDMNMKQRYELVGSFEDVMAWNNGYVMKNCTTLMYFKFV